MPPSSSAPRAATGLTRRVALGVLAGCAGASFLPLPASAQAPTPAPVEIARLSTALNAGIERDESGAVTAVFGLAVQEAREMLQMATKADALPSSYRPRDLVGAPAVGVPASGFPAIRAVTVPDTRAMVEAAAAEGHDLWVLSAFRSYAEQVQIFANAVNRRGDEELANRFSARPGQSQHQLGTTLDMTNQFRAFGSSPAGQWLWANAHRFGYVFPYTDLNQERTGYVSEPWHVRWVGTPLAQWMYDAGYQAWTDLTADDVVALVRAAAGFPRNEST